MTFIRLFAMIFVSFALSPAGTTPQLVPQKTEQSGVARRQVEVLYRAGATESDRNRVRKALRAVSVVNLGDPNQEAVTVDFPNDETAKKRLVAAQKDRAVVSVRLSGTISIK